jgi:serine/threonine-protein kinase
LPSVTSPSRTPSTAPPESGFPLDVGYVGENGDGTISVAIAIKGTAAVAYLCDGSNVEAWLRGTAIDGKLKLSGEQSSSLTAVGKADTVSGTLRTAIGTWPFQAQIATGPAGLYRANATLKGVQQRLSWIVKQNGTQTGVVSDASGKTQAAPALDVTSLSTQDGGTTVTATKITGDAVLAQPTRTP